MAMVQKAFGCQLPIEALHGAPAVPWNAGRTMKALPPADEFVKVLIQLHSKNIGYFPTFSNHLVQSSDLSNTVCNGILDSIVQRPNLNAVIIVSDLLSKYIAERYPALRQIASIIKVSLDGGRGKPEYYSELGKRFWRYVVHPDDIRDLKLMDQLDRDKAEIIVNENCVADCPTRMRHYTAYAAWQRAPNEMERQIVNQELEQIVAGCQSPFHLHRLGNQRRSCNLTRQEIRTLYEMGFRRFKLQGRLDDPWSYSYDLIRFTLEPEFAAPLMYKSLCRWLEKAVTRVKS